MNCIHSAALCCQWRSKRSMYRCDFVYIGILIKSYGYKPMTKAKWNKNPKQVLYIWSFDTAISAGIQMYMKRFEAETNCIRFDLIYSLAFMPIVCVSLSCDGSVGKDFDQTYSCLMMPFNEWIYFTSHAAVLVVVVFHPKNTDS